MNAQLSLNLVELAQLRRDAETAERARHEYLERLLADPKLNDLSFTAKEIGDRLELAEAELRRQALSEYACYGKDDLPKGVKVVVKHEVSYQIAEAIKWCLTSAPEFLRLAGREFESYALKVAEIKPVPGVTISEKPQAQISKDLSEYLQAEEASE